MDQALICSDFLSLFPGPGLSCCKPRKGIRGGGTDLRLVPSPPPQPSHQVIPSIRALIAKSKSGAWRLLEER